MSRSSELELADAVVAWWAEHQYDTVADSDGHERNVYDKPPAFVAIARRILGQEN